MYDYAPFLTNRSGFPINAETWKSMFDFCLKQNRDCKKQITDLYESFQDHVISKMPVNYSYLHNSLSLLINNYTEAYHGHHHKLLRVKIGLPISHRPYMLEKIQWKVNQILLNKQNNMVYISTL
ncbi:unnamed protein product [Schistosoma mattheei]|uniref:Uncharacterized protein n=1 Tax=Schistosoma mattheei TaxID=31246 RepID=A0A183P8B6_9TREM|nr:unnamed protein product [Schistosoma mattheei]